MKERFGVAVEEGTVEKLRELAGGPRKVGVFLSDVISWLWLHREQLETRPLSDFVPILQKRISRVDMTSEEQQDALEVEGELFWRRQYREQQQRLEQLEAQVNQLGASIGALQVSVEDTAKIN